ncbi:YhcN/YlaJ family sporulation lipoprotein [Metabacillus sp. Hm71]|uniref:YhcN/YlaJ family sporulation lipoprotein n=1 Tax=Metabacillus sp. Hm71 TaxID=3450743 RepID=UPI003F440066
MKHGRTIMTNILFVLIIVGSGCNGANIDNENNEQNIKNVTSESKNMSVSNQVKQLFMKQKEVSDVKVVNFDKDLFIAAEIKQMERFRIKEIENKLKKLAEDHFPNYHVTLSTDKKILLELNELEKQVNETNISKKKLEKELNRIKSLSEELT